MDELRGVAWFTAEQSAPGAFRTSSQHCKTEQKKKTEPPPLPELISIRNGNYSTDTVNEDDLLRDDNQDTALGDSVSGPGLDMVVVGRGGDDAIQLPRETFERLIWKFNIDSITLQHVYTCSYGFYYYDDNLYALGESSSKRTRSFYFGCFLFAVVWSFDVVTEKTSAILILRTIKRHYHGTLPLDALRKAFEAYRYRFKSPLSLAFILHTILAHVLDDNLYRIVKKLRKTEVKTNHGPSSKDWAPESEDDSDDDDDEEEEEEKGRDPTEEEARRKHIGRQETGFRKLLENEEHIRKLTKVAKKLANVNVHLANLSRHAKLLKSMADTLGDSNFREVYHKDNNSGNAAGWEKTTNFFLAALPPLARRLTEIQPSISYLEDRAKGQHQVVFGLLTHEDAEVNLRVARGNMDIAHAARNDSSAMKTIALMTMIFLPGTFFAALFDQPTLNWEPTRPGVVQDGFWIYWVLTVPATLFVLLTSWVIHRGWEVLGKERGEKAQNKWDAFKKKFTGEGSGEGRAEEPEKFSDNGSFKGLPM